MQPLEFGTATSSLQIEGALDADGRGVSIWETFTARPGAIRDGSDGSVACSSYDYLEDDLELIADLGLQVYRFSIAWPRVQPSGSGALEPRGLDYYERVVDGLLARGVRPLPTLYHWDLPQPLEDAGGWPVRTTAERFAEYAGIVNDRIGDRVEQWATLNEPWCTAFLGYAAGVHAPGRTEPDAAYAAVHHLLLAHALASEVLGVEKSGLALNLAPVHAVDDASADAARIVDAIRNRVWLDPLLDGTYPVDLVERVPLLADPSIVRAGDLDRVRGSLAWLGINYYTPERVGPPTETVGVGQHGNAYPYAPAHGFHPRPPFTEMGWEVDPSGLETLLIDVSRRAPGLPLAITENGVAYADQVRDDTGTVIDDDRIAYFEAHLEAVDRARAAGADVRSYMAWSLLDNFEWAEGYTKLFGLASIDPETLRRKPKRSFEWYAGMIARTRLR